MQQSMQSSLTKTVLWTLFAVLATSLVLAQDVTSNSMPGTDFGKYHTYKWVKIEGAEYPNQIMDAQIQASVDKQLATKGLTKTDGDNADLDVGYQTSVSQSKEWNAYSTGGMRWGGGMGTATESTINTGTLVLDMYDPANKQLVWQGRATKTLDPGAKEDKRLKDLDKATEKLMKNFPPKQG